MFVNDVQRDPAFFRNHVAEKRFQKNWRYLFFWVDLDAAKNESYQAVQDGTAGKTEWEQAEDWYTKKSFGRLCGDQIDDSIDDKMKM